MEIGGARRMRRSKQARLQIGKHACMHASRDHCRNSRRSSALNLRNAPNRFAARRLQQALGGEYHETCFCTCWSRRARRRCTLYRAGVCDACRRSGSGLASFGRSAGSLRLQRMGPLLAPAELRRRLLPSALLWWLGLASLASLALTAAGDNGWHHWHHWHGGWGTAGTTGIPLHGGWGYGWHHWHHWHQW